MSGTYEKIYTAVRKIPKGRVATYGQIARLCGIPMARQVGYALSALKEGSNVPWQRVVNAKGEISGRTESYFAEQQRALLAVEGILFTVDAKIDLERFQWKLSKNN